MKHLVLVFLMLVTCVLAKQYPETSLKCYSYLTKPDKKLICPAARAKYCVKEVTTLTQNLCGQTQYFGDSYENSICQFKKCSAECVEGSYNFKYQGLDYSRTRYCCTTDYCNSAPGGLRNLISMTLLLCSLLFSVLYLL